MSQIFTDRESICNDDEGVFWKELDKLKNNKGAPTIINIHGIAGIGKTTVNSYLISRLEEKGYKDYFFYKMDKDGYGIKLEKERFLIEFAYHLIVHHHGIDLSSFLYAYGKTKDQSDPEQAIIDSLNSMKDKYKTTIDVVSEIVLNPVPYGDLIKKGIEVALDHYRKAPGKDKRKEIDGDSPEVLRENLLYYFIEDAFDFFEKLDHPYIVFIDDFERFILSGGDVHDEIDKQWFNKLTSGFPNILWVITGRDKIGWNDHFGEEDIDQQILLQAFDDEKYVREFFDKYSECSGAPKISDDMVKYLWKLTKGVPFYLKLCLDSYIACEDKKNITREEFGKDTEELWKRFYNNYTEEQKDLMAFLCTLPDNWTDDEALSVYKNINEDYRGNIKDFRKVFDTLKDTSAFTFEDGVFRIHDVVRMAVLQNAKELDDRQLFIEYLEAQKKRSARYGKQGFWVKECSYRENVCNRLKEWGSTRGEYEKYLADSLVEWGDGLVYIEGTDIFPSEEQALTAVTKYEEALGYYQDKSCWDVVEAYVGLIDAYLFAYEGQNAEVAAKKCFNIIKEYHSDDWKRSVTELFRIWNRSRETDDEILDHIISLLDAHPNEKNKRIREIASYIKDRDESLEEDEDYDAYMEELAEEFNMEMESIIDGICKDCDEFLKDYETRTEPYSEEECEDILTLINNKTEFFAPDDLVIELSEKLYEIRKRQNGGKENADTVTALKARVEYLEISENWKELEELWEKVCDIQLSDDYDSDRSGLGNDLLALANVKRDAQKLDETIKCYELILENYDEYEDNIDKTKDEILEILEELK